MSRADQVNTLLIGIEVIFLCLDFPDAARVCMEMLGFLSACEPLSANQSSLSRLYATPSQTPSWASTKVDISFTHEISSVGARSGYPGSPRMISLYSSKMALEPRSMT